MESQLRLNLVFFIYLFIYLRVARRPLNPGSHGVYFVSHVSLFRQHKIFGNVNKSYFMIGILCFFFLNKYIDMKKLTVFYQFTVCVPAVTITLQRLNNSNHVCFVYRNMRQSQHVLLSAY